MQQNTQITALIITTSTKFLNLIGYQLSWFQHYLDGTSSAILVAYFKQTSGLWRQLYTFATRSRSCIGLGFTEWYEKNAVEKRQQLHSTFSQEGTPDWLKHDFPTPVATWWNFARQNIIIWSALHIYFLTDNWWRYSVLPFVWSHDCQRTSLSDYLKSTFKTIPFRILTSKPFCFAWLQYFSKCST